MRILKTVKRIRQKKMLNLVSQYVDLAQYAIYNDNFYIDIRNPEHGRV